MKNRTIAGISASLLVAATLTGCSQAEDSADQASHSEHSQHSEQTASSENSAESEAPAHDHEGMEHPMDGGPAPDGIEVAESPKFPVGSQARMTADHMDGMEGATATISGAFKTFTYSVNHDPVDGGERVVDHRWVVQEELQDVGEERLADGTPVTILADHMSGMKGAKGEIAYSTDETVYMVDYESDGMKMTNHKWVTESELEALN